MKENRRRGRRGGWVDGGEDSTGRKVEVGE